MPIRGRRPGIQRSPHRPGSSPQARANEDARCSSCVLLVPTFRVGHLVDRRFEQPRDPERQRQRGRVAAPLIRMRPVDCGCLPECTPPGHQPSRTRRTAVSSSCRTSLTYGSSQAPRSRIPQSKKQRCPPCGRGHEASGPAPPLNDATGGPAATSIVRDILKEIIRTQTKNEASKTRNTLSATPQPTFQASAYE